MTSYKATGITLKATPMGENDRLLTVLTREHGLIRAVAPGARKHQSTLRGRSGVFVVNNLLVVKGRSLDKIIQAEGVESFPGLSQDLRKLTAAQYLAELVLCQALSDQPQEELFQTLRDALHRLETFPADTALSCLTHTTFQLLRLAGVAPQVERCCISRENLLPDWSSPEWRVGFHAGAGGTVRLEELERLDTKKVSPPEGDSSSSVPQYRNLAENREGYAEALIPDAGRPPTPANRSVSRHQRKKLEPGFRLNALELAALQRISQPEPLQDDGWGHSSDQRSSDEVWRSLERILRHYAQYHFEQPIQSALLIDSCFSPLP